MVENEKPIRPNIDVQGISPKKVKPSDVAGVSGKASTGAEASSEAASISKKALGILANAAAKFFYNPDGPKSPKIVDAIAQGKINPKLAKKIVEKTQEKLGDEGLGLV